jgi:hypothetical protein
VEEWYELQLYLHLIEPLSTLYEYIYQEKATEMFSFISSKSLEDLGVQEPWIRGTTVDNTEVIRIALVMLRSFPIMLFDRIILSSSLLTGLNPAVTQSSVFNIPLEISSLVLERSIGLVK